MRNKTSFWKRSLAALLSLVMVLGMIPVFGFAPLAYAEENADTTDATDESDEGYVEQGPDIDGNYITLPIKIRDYAADGMLFEYNEVGIGKGTDATYETESNLEYVAHTVQYNPWYWDLNSTDGTLTSSFDLTGLRVYTAAYGVYSTLDNSETSGAYWYCLILDANGNVLKVMDLEANKEDIDTVVANTTGAAYSVWAWRDSSNIESYTLLANIYEEYQAELTEQKKTNEDDVAVANAIQAISKYRFIITGIADDGGEDTTASLYLGMSAYMTASQWNQGTAENPDYTGLRIYQYGDLNADTLGDFEAWHCLICDASGNVVRVIPRGRDKVADYKHYMEVGLEEGYYTVWAWSDPSNQSAYNKISGIRNGNKEEYTVRYLQQSSTGYALFIDQTRNHYYTDITDTDGNTVRYYYGDTKAFGLLATSTTDHYGVLGDTAASSGSTTFSNIIYGSQLFANGSWSDKTDPAVATSYLYSAADRTTPYASQEIYGAKVRTNLVDMGLDAEGHPIYTEETVTFLADFLEIIMQVPWQNEDGSFNTYHVEGVKLFSQLEDGSFYYWPTVEGIADEHATHDLADVLRYQVMEKQGDRTLEDMLGTYEASKQKFDNGGLRSYLDVETWFDAAYFLLNNFWRDSSMDMFGTIGRDGYGLPIDRYESLHLVETTNENGDICYVFNAKYNNTRYDWDEGDIYNTELNEDYDIAQSGGEDTYAYGNILPVARFDPLGKSGADVNQGYGMSGNTYGDMTGHSATQNWGEYYDETNYHMSLQGSAQFVYHYDANQYFTFTGDDDVYLYINGVRVLDIGAAHSISKVKIDLNKVAEVCGLHDGGTYAFDFFFLERHGTAANFGIETNIQIADASMNTYKTGYQKGASTGYNGWVDGDEKVGYSFELQNDGDAHIYNLTFNDEDINVYFGYNGVTLNGDSNSKLEEMYMLKRDANGNYTMYLRPGDVTVDVIKSTLAAGLEPGERIGIYGFKYLISDAEWAAGNGTFTNTVYTSATTDPDKTTADLHGTSDWKVRKMNMPFTPFHVYDWVNKDVSQNPDTVCDWRTPEVAGLPFDDGVTVPQEKLLQYFKDYVEEYNEGKADDEKLSLNTTGLKTVLCTASGQEDAYNLDPNVTLNDDGSITYKSTTTGLHTVFYKIKNSGLGTAYDDYVFNYDVYTYGSVNNVYVLDYGLSVELAGDTFGYHNNDYWQIDQNTKYPLSEDHTVLGMVDAEGKEITAKAGTYGDFAWVAEKDEDGNVIGGSLKYTPDEIINGTDSVFAAFRMMEQEAIDNGDEPSIYNSVVMAQEITTAPASVVYYEEDFPGITFVNSTPKPKADLSGYWLDEGGEYILQLVDTRVKLNADGYLVDEDGNLLLTTGNSAIQIDTLGQLVDAQGNQVLDQNGDPITVDKVKYQNVDGYLVDADGNQILDKDANPIKVNKDGYQTDDEGYLVDAEGNQILDQNENPIKVFGAGYLVNAESCLVDAEGNQILDQNENPIKVDEKGNLVDAEIYLLDANGSQIQDKNGSLIKADKDGNLMNAEGYLLDKDSEQVLYSVNKRVKLNTAGYLVDEDNDLILAQGTIQIKVDEEGNLVDDQGNPIEDDTITIQPVMVQNEWVRYETVDDDGNSVAGTEQSADQDSNYGSDPNYGAGADEETNLDDYTGGDKIGTLEPEGEVENVITLNLDTSDLNAAQAAGIAALNEYFGLGGADSNGTVNKLEVNQTGAVMYFEFVGTGFELISRTTADEYAVINVQVQKYDEATGTYTVVRQKPVVTESKGGDLYQVPIISITGLTKDTYRVVVQAATTGKVNRVLYVDGIRIYGPLGDDEALEYYNPAEYQAAIFEIKQMIQDGQMIYADLGVFDGALQFGTGSTMVENTELGSVLVPIDDVNQYMKIGPNNELYLDGNNVISVLTFTITPIANYPDAARTLQIGAHRKANENTSDMGAAVLTYASDFQKIYDRSEKYLNEFVVDETNSYSIASGTEMYYTIDVKNLTKQSNGSYLVMIAAIGSEMYGTNLALTNIKMAGYTFSNAQTILLDADSEGTVDDEPMVAQTFGLLRSVRELLAKEPEVEQIPVNENLTITSAALTATKVVSGRTATLTVKTSAEAEKIVLLDSQGNEVTATRCVRKVVRGVVTFTFIWKVTGSSGQALNYTVRAYDADGLASVNTESVTVTIR